MLINKRPTHPVLKLAEGLIESWRHDLIVGLAVDPEVAAYVLVLTACSKIQIEGKAAIRAVTAAAIEHAVRSNLFALQFGLKGIEGLLPHRKFNEDCIAGSINPTLMQKASTVLEGMKRYALVRDIFLGYYYGAYDIQTKDPRRLVFSDVPAWRGDIDFAETFLSSETKTARTPANEYPPTEDVTSDFPPNLHIGHVSSDAFRTLWVVLARILADFVGTGGAPVLQQSELVARLRQATDLPSDVVEGFVDLITLRPTSPPQLTLFHCPVVPLTQFDVQIVTPAVFGANISTTVMRLAVYRGGGLSKVSKSLETFFLGRLEQQFSLGQTLVRLGRQYSTAQDRGDIDIVVYEPLSKVLTLAQAKTFIYPDSVPEVFDANEDIENAISQVGRTFTWFSTAHHNERKAVLDLPELSEDSKVSFAVLANGFVGSDFLTHSQDILFGDIRYLMRPEFKGASFHEALRSFSSRLSELKLSLKRMIGEETIQVGNVEVTCPALGFEIRVD